MVFMKSDPKGQGKIRTWVPRSFCIAWIVFTTWLTLRLISERNYYSATAWIIITILSLFLLAALLINAREDKVPVKGPDKLRAKVVMRKGGEFVLLCSSKDIIRISQIELALKSRDIDCVVLDYHGSVMMSFIPDIEMRIMVPCKDYDWSVQIMNELIEEPIQQSTLKMTRPS